MQLTNAPMPMLRRIAAVLVGLEALALVVSAAVTVSGAITADAPADVSVAIAIMALIIAAPLALACRALWNGRTWPRGLVVTWQALQIAAGTTLLDWSTAAGVAAIAIAVACASVVLADARASQSATTSDHGLSEQ